MIVLTCEQRSAEWFEAKRGIPSASSFDKIVMSDGSPSKQALGYLYQLAAERVSGIKETSFSSAAMDEGVRREEESRLVYAMHREVEVTQVGFCLDDFGRYGCSPDGLVGDDWLVELKNPSGKVAVEYLLAGKLPTEYVQQVQGQIFVTERDWCDFVSYYSGLPTLIVRVERDEEFQRKLEKALVAFCDTLDAACEAIKKEGA